jgi:ubiquinone/menaquinone biosynthesis C-methylase UbiE
LIATLKKFIRSHVFKPPVYERDVVEAYDLWAQNYDAQPGNLMLALDEKLFAKLLAGVEIRDKQVADIGCGTGRHWQKLMQYAPAGLTGFDVSPGMLQKLKDKFPSAVTYVIDDNQFKTIADNSFDVIVSTLTVAHIENIEEALKNWCRVLTYEADLVITDFHPDALAFGGKRTFSHQKKQIAVRNFVHSISVIKEILLQYNFKVVMDEEIKIDETVKHYYTEQNAGHVYEKFNGFPIIYGAHFRRK